MSKKIEDTIKYDDIEFFNKSKIGDNDPYNKKREEIMVAIINKKINEDYYKRSLRWKELKDKLNIFLEDLYGKNITCELKAGRGNHFDFFILNEKNQKIKLEFKFNVNNVDQCPQFVSPSKPSQYLDKNFEEWYYDNYLPKIISQCEYEIPSKEEYLKQIHSNKVECMKPFKVLYDKNKNFREHCKKIDKEAIEKFIKLSNINIVELSNYLFDSQNGKEYILYKDGNFTQQKIDSKHFKIKEIIKREPTNYIALTDSGIKFQIKLRFKNGCGLQFPAFQISRKIPSVNELKLLCVENNIDPPKLKPDILQKLNENGIIY